MECLHRIPCHSMNLGSCASDVSHKSATILAKWNAMKHICLMISGFHEMIRPNNRRVVDYMYKKGGTYSQTICIWIREMLTLCASQSLLNRSRQHESGCNFEGKFSRMRGACSWYSQRPRKGKIKWRLAIFG